MTITVCNRCGKKIANFPWQATTFPYFTIKIVRYAGSGVENVDLCPDCSRAFYEWTNQNKTDTIEAKEE